MHDVDRVVDFRVFGDEDRTLTIGSTTAGECSVFVRAAPVTWYHGPEAEGLVEAVLQVLRTLQGAKGNVSGVLVGAEGVDDGLTEFCEDFGVAQELVEEPGEQRGGCVAAGEEDVEHLSTEFFGVAGLLCESFEEDIFLFTVTLLGLAVLWIFFEC